MKIHKSTASKVFNVPLEEVTREQRSHAKDCEFRNYIWGFGFGLSNQTNLSRSESAALIEAYYQSSSLKSYISSQVDFARDNGYVQTVLGRRYFKDINSQNAIA
jgi:DNA polymerase-1